MARVQHLTGEGCCTLWQRAHEGDAIGTQRRGRPPGRVADLAAPDGQLFNPGPRIGWLLRTNRLAGLPGVSAREFSGLLADQGVAADPSRVSRWETGLVPAPLAVVETYERLVDLDPGGLRAIATLQHRVASGRIVCPTVLPTGAAEPAHLERMLDAVVDGDPDGRSWLELGLSVAAAGERLVLPRSLWRSLAGRLVRQASLSVGSAYLTRNEAAIHLTSHPSARNALVYAVGEMLTEPDIPVVTDPLALLQEIDSAQANDLILKLLDQERLATRNGAAWAAAAKLDRGHFDAAETVRLEAQVLRLARTHGLDRAGGFHGLVDLVDVLPAPARSAAYAAAGGVRGEPVEEVTPDPGQVAAVVNEVLAEGAVEDPMLELLVRIALADPRLEHRFLAAFTLHQSPFRSVVARVAARWVDSLLDGTPVHGEVAHRLMVALSILATPEQTESLLRVAGSDSPLRGMGLVAVAHLPPGTTLRRPQLGPLLEGPDDQLARTAAYCAGMTGDPVLRRVVERDDLPEARRRAALWWVDHGPAVREERGGRRPGVPDLSQPIS